MAKILQPVKNLTIPDNGNFNGEVPVMDFAYLDGYIYYIRDQSIHRLGTNGDDEAFLALAFDPACTTIHAYQGKLLIYKLIRNVELVKSTHYAGETEKNTYYITNTIEIHTVDISTRQVDFLNVISTAMSNFVFSAYYYFEPFNNSTCFIHNEHLYVVGHIVSSSYYYHSENENYYNPDIPAITQSIFPGATSSPFVARIKLDQFSMFEMNPTQLGSYEGNRGEAPLDIDAMTYSPPYVSDKRYAVDGISALSFTKLSSYTKVFVKGTKTYGGFEYGVRGGIPIVKSDDGTIYLLPALPNICNAYNIQSTSDLHNNTMFVCSVSDIDTFLTSSTLSQPKNTSSMIYSEDLNGITRPVNLTDSSGISSPACIVDDKIYLFGGITYADTGVLRGITPGNSTVIYLGCKAIYDSTEILSKILVYNVTTGAVSEMELPYPNSKGGCPIVNGEYIYVPTDAGIGVYQLKEYNITYSIKGSNVDISLEGNTPISKITFSSSLGYQYYNLETLTGTLTGSYEAVPPSGYRIIGYSLKPRAKTPDFILGETYEISIDKDTTFYEVYGIYRPPVVTFELNLYQNTAERNRVDKTNYLTLQGTMQGALRGECSLTSPVITVELEDIPFFNYAYIEKFGRWYYVTDITSLRANLWVISLTVDVLMTYKEGIKLCSALIDRNENSYDPLIVDNKLPLKQGQTVTEYTLNNTVFTDGQGQFLLTGVLVSSGDAVEAQTLSVETEEELEPLSAVEESEV